MKSFLVIIMLFLGLGNTSVWGKPNFLEFQKQLDKMSGEFLVKKIDLRGDKKDKTEAILEKYNSLRLIFLGKMLKVSQERRAIQKNTPTFYKGIAHVIRSEQKQRYDIEKLEADKIAELEKVLSHAEVSKYIVFSQQLDTHVQRALFRVLKEKEFHLD